MKNKNILIVDDELIIAENLRLILNEHGYNCVDVSCNANEVKELFTKTSYQLVLMDINLGENSTIDGVDLINDLIQKYSFIYIYITANADQKTIEKVKNTQPFSYIIKPFISSTIYANIEIALNSINDTNYFTYTKKGVKHDLLLSAITYIEADGVYINIYTFKGEKHFVRKYLNEFLQLYSNTFIRIHKSILINRSNIQSYNSQFVSINDKKLPIGRAYKQNFLQQIQNNKTLDV